MSLAADGSEHHTPSSTAFSQPANEALDETKLKLHRVRFVDWSPSSVTALAFPPLPPPSGPGKKLNPQKQRENCSYGSENFGILAVGRGNGNIEICRWTGAARDLQAPQSWVLEKVLAAPGPSKVESLVFAIRHPHSLPQNRVPSESELRLFSSGGGTDVLEWDVEGGLLKPSLSSQGGSIWSMAVNPASTMLALGCEDGSVRLLSLEYGALEHHKRFDRSKSRMLSIAWGPPLWRKRKPLIKPVDDTASSDEDEDGDAGGWEDSWLVTGGSDSCIRKWDMNTGRVIERMETDKARGEKTLVWAVGVLADSTIVSGDSLGMVKFWDPVTATQLHSFRAHAADVLCLAIGPTGTLLYSAGVDQKVTQFALTAASSVGPSKRWIQTHSRRLHAHDIRSLAIWPPHSTFPTGGSINPKLAPVLVSGGLDMVVCQTPCAPASQGLENRIKVVNPLATSLHSTFEESYQRKMAYPSIGIMSFAVNARLVMCRKDRGVALWRVGSRENADGDDPPLRRDFRTGPEPMDWEMVLEMDLNVKTNLMASAISPDGKWVAVSDSRETKLFRLDENKRRKIVPTRIKGLNEALSTTQLDLAAASNLIFTPDSFKLIMSCSPSPFVVILDLTLALTDGDVRVLRTFSHHRMKNVGSGRVIKSLVSQLTLDGDEAMPLAEEIDQGADEPESQEPNRALICCSAVSVDGQWFASADLRGRCHVFNIDSLQHHCTLPSFEHPIRALAFDPKSSEALLIGLPNNTIHVFDIEQRNFPEWSSRVCNNLPETFKGLHDPLQGLFFLPSQPPISLSTSPPPETSHRQALVWGSNWICKIKLDAGYSPRRRNKNKKRKSSSHQKFVVNGDAEETNNFQMQTKYRQMLAVGLFGDREIVVVERPLVDVLSESGQPPPFYKHKYGT